MTVQTSTQIRIQAHEDYWYTIEDTNIDCGVEGCTLSLWGDEGRGDYFCMDEEEALALADAIYKLFKKGN